MFMHLGGIDSVHAAMSIIPKRKDYKHIQECLAYYTKQAVERENNKASLSTFIRSKDNE